jgi:hypothetical protein
MWLCLGVDLTIDQQQRSSLANEVVLLLEAAQSDADRSHIVGILFACSASADIHLQLLGGWLAEFPDEVLDFGR